MRILFAGSPGIAVPSLEALAESRHEVVGVLTNPDAVRGRGRNACVTHVKEIGVDLGYPIIQPRKLDAEVREEVAALKPDILVAVAYGRIFGPKFLDLFPLGGLNLHPSLLPKYRGCSPVNAAILHGDSKSGVTIQRLAHEMDSGEILKQEIYPLKGNEKADKLLDIFSEIGARLLIETLDEIESGTIEGHAQDEADVSFCTFIKKEDGLIPWVSSAVEIDRMARAYCPWPGIYTTFKGQKLNIADVSVYTGDLTFNNSEPGKVLGIDKNEGILIQTGDGILAALSLQLQARKAMDFKSFLNGNKDFTGSLLGG
ncbi:MAG: methionyl-tRNA formyltransferase [Spirochaetales bacterium]|nr:methionyl-tRNA formyltransferase [Spirochaetales bacterium]